MAQFTKAQLAFLKLDLSGALADADVAPKDRAVFPDGSVIEVHPKNSAET